MVTFVFNFIHRRMNLSQYWIFVLCFYLSFQWFSSDIRESPQFSSAAYFLSLIYFTSYSSRSDDCVKTCNFFFFYLSVSHSLTMTFCMGFFNQSVEKIWKVWFPGKKKTSWYRSPTFSFRKGASIFFIPRCSELAYNRVKARSNFDMMS